MNVVQMAKTTAAALAGLVAWIWGRLRGRVVKAVGGPARTRVVVLFAGVLALSSAQISTVGAVAPQLESSLHLDNTRIGLINSVTLIVGAVAVIPIGLIVDRIRRVPVLSISIVLWSVATILSAVADSYGALLLTRVVLGIVSATAGPAIASLTGDYFPSHERGRVYGYILTGEILGTAVGFVICGNVAGLFGWRAAFWVLAIPGFFLARSLWRTVPEPQRGGYSHLERGVKDLRHRAPRAGTEAGGPAAGREQDLAFTLADEQGYQPDPELVLRRDPDSMSLREAVRYILSIPSNLLMIISSSLGYFFFSGLETFATVFVRSHFHTGEGEATLVLGVLVIGAVVGTLVVGPICDRLTRRGQLAARVWIPAVCNIAAGLLLIPGFLANSLHVALPFCFLGTALISAANPPLDAARLDIMPSGLWGRAESTRTFLRSLAQAVAPLAFGGVADLVAGFTPHQAPVGTHTGQIVSGTGTGLQVSFLSMLVTLLAAGYFLWRARPAYPRDVATASAAFTPRAAAAGSAAGPGADAGPGPGADAGSGVMVADLRASEDPTVVRRPDGDPTVVREADGDPTAVREADGDPTVVREADGDPTVVREADGDPTVVREADEDPTIAAPDRGDDDTEPLIRPR